MHYWLIKTEPDTYSWVDLIKEKHTQWSGVRNYQARNYLRAMKKGDLAFVYHSVRERAIQGIAKVIHEAVVDDTATKGDWSMVEFSPIQSFKNPVTLDVIKQHAGLKKMVLVHHSRLSVQPVTKEEWEICLNLSKVE